MIPNLSAVQTVECDVLIIGAGGVGMRCAAEILENRPETRVIALTKVAHAQKSHTSTAQGGLSAVGPKDPEDLPLYHMFDTWKGSDCTADQNVVKKICEMGWEQLLWLENHGMHFSRNSEGGFARRTFGGHTVRFGEASAFRAVFEADRTGKGIMDTGWGESLKRGVRILNQTLAVELLFAEGECVGCLVFRQKEGEFVRILAKATVVTAGGCGQVFKVTTNCRQNTGDYLSLVLQAALPVMNPEAVQFHPTGIVGPGILASETLRSVGGILRNKDQEPFMEIYAPKMKELAPRDMVARAIETEIHQGRGILNPDHRIEHVWIDLRHLPASVHENDIPEVTSFFKRYINLDPMESLCPVRPSVHYHMGGIPTNEFGEVETSRQVAIPGLYAGGESAAASFHGFNRLGTNSLLELLVMGKVIGERVLENIKQKPTPSSNSKVVTSHEKFDGYLQARGNASAGNIRESLRALMTEQVGVFRSEEGLTQALERIKELKADAEKVSLTTQSLKMNQELVQRWELDNLLDVAMVMCVSALNRKESRGAHFRTDFDQRKDEYNYHTLISMPEFGATELGKRAVDISLFEAGGPDKERFGLIQRKY